MRPERLRPGDLVALISPAGPVDPDRAAAAAGVLEHWGLRTRFGAHALARRHGYLSGSDDERLADLDDALRDPGVRGVVCLRGGYGTQRIADRVDFGAVRRDPKLLIGFSDITALHAALWRETGLATVHGPNGATLARSAAEARRALMTADQILIKAEKSGREGADTDSGIGTGAGTSSDRDNGTDNGHDTDNGAHNGADTDKGTDMDSGTGNDAGSATATGTLLGGNLTVLAAGAGTPHQLDLRGAILLLEEVNEADYRIDRMLVQLRRSGTLDGVAGIALGQFLPRCPRGILDEHLGALGVPVVHGLPIGHGDHQVAVPLGVPARLDATTGTLTVEPACR